MKNIGKVDKTIRIIMAIILMIIPFLIEFTTFEKVIVYIIAAIILATCVIGVCPLYIPFKINTCAKCKEKNTK